VDPGSRYPWPRVALTAVDELERRVSDAEREEAADMVRRAAGEGRLTVVELDERLGNVYASKTWGELIKITADLPEARTTVPAVVEPATPAQLRVVLSDIKRRGAWQVPRRLDVAVYLGEVSLDFTEADIPYPEVFIDARVVLGDIKIRVPADAVVHIDGQPFLGSITEKGTRDTSQATTPTVFHVKGSTLFGDIKVRRGPGLTKRMGIR
jgi:hypothetical protein